VYLVRSPVRIAYAQASKDSLNCNVQYIRYVSLNHSNVSAPLVLQINDRYEFPLQLDLDRENGKYLSPDADRSVRNLYTLHRYGTEVVT
jgi:hypothetical protein